MWQDYWPLIFARYVYGKRKAPPLLNTVYGPQCDASNGSCYSCCLLFAIEGRLAILQKKKRNEHVANSCEKKTALENCSRRLLCVCERRVYCEFCLFQQSRECNLPVGLSKSSHVCCCCSYTHYAAMLYRRRSAS